MIKRRERMRVARSVLYPDTAGTIQLITADE